MSLWAGPLSYVYQSVTDIKNDLFAKKAFKIHHLPVPVISIGNLTVGGTGKTPFTDYTIKYFLNHNRRVGVVSRAYKAQAKNPVQVDLSARDPSRRFGDEPVWLARQNPQAAVFVGSTKWRIAEWAVEQKKLDLILVDDGYQHRKLHRDLNILILDATEKEDNYRVLPLGRAREKFENIDRADLVVLSKCNMAEPAELENLRRRIPAGKTVVETGFRLSHFKSLRGHQRKSRAEFAGSKVLAFCSIARPEIFKKSLLEIFSEVELLPFSDHHEYHVDDIASILKKMQKSGISHICCTEKDAVKLESLWPADQELWVSELEIEILQNKDQLHAIYHRFCS